MTFSPAVRAELVETLRLGFDKLSLSGYSSKIVVLGTDHSITINPTT
jgi:hypothetical protein